MKKLLKNYVYNLLYQMFLIITPVITAPYLARVLGANQLGIYGYVNSITSIISAFGLLGLNNYGIRQIAYYQNDVKKKNEIFVEVTTARILLLIIVSFIYFIAIPNFDYPTLFFIQYFLIVALFTDSSWFMIGIEEMGVVTFRNFVAKLVTVVAIFIFVKDESDLPIYLGLFSVITLLTTVSLSFYMKKYIQWYWSSLENIKKHLAPSLMLFLPQIASILYLQIDKIMINYLTNDPSQVAYYDQADKFIQIPLALITALGTVMMPRIAAEFKQKNTLTIHSYINKTLSFVLFISLPMVFGLIAIAPNLIPWYLGNDFLPVITAIIVLSPLVLFNSLSNISGNQYFTATNQTKYLTIAYFVGTIINIILNFFLIPLFEFKGAAIASVIATIILVTIQYYYMSRQIKLSKTFMKSWKYLLVSLLMGSIVYCTGSYLPASPKTTGFQLVFGIFIYCFMLFLTKDEMMLFLSENVLKFTKKNMK